MRGYEFAQGPVRRDDATRSSRRSRRRATGRIEIEEFVPIEKVDPVYFEKSNLLGPDKGGTKAYELLNQAMLAAGKVAIGRFSTRGQQQLVLIRPVENGLDDARPLLRGRGARASTTSSSATRSS